MAAYRKCCIPGCDNTRESSVLHKFPNPQNDCKRFRTWTFSIGGNILALDDNHSICKRLFFICFVVRKPLADTMNKNYNMVECNLESTPASTSEKGLLPANCQETADIIIFFDELFDSMNGSYINSSKRSGKPLLKTLKPNSLHNQIWTKAKQNQ
ncbi:unnamed protein product [Leptidea sinapis]|uniref:THAP-type domain-containing protein n=1 Tax=Leptidea sinapis TaxID=189913 RepID=A0A5E4Q7K8_9NEOP|nr:unnamed protein product [Leptidea sinapis]